MLGKVFAIPGGKIVIFSNSDDEAVLGARRLLAKERLLVATRFSKDAVVVFGCLALMTIIC